MNKSNLSILNRCCINPEICKNCQFHWRLSINEQCEIQNIACVDYHNKESLNYHNAIIYLRVEDTNRFLKDQKFLFDYAAKQVNNIIITHTEYTKHIIFQPDKILYRLVKACKNLYIYEGCLCPYYAEHLISSWNHHE